jgi:FkbM family methyltransferase
VTEDSKRHSRVRASVAEGVQRLLRRAGYELHPYAPGPQASADDLRRAKLMTSEGVDLVLDVGANAGYYAERLRGAGYSGRIVSFEPLSDAYAELRRRSAADPGWEARRVALSDEDGEAEIHVSANSWSSSLLDMGARHLESAPESAYVSKETVPTARLDTLWDEVVEPSRRPWLKLDVQGFELHVVRGAASRLDAVHGMQVELALMSLYDGDSLWREVVDSLESRGLRLAGVEPGFEDPDTGRMLQFDGIFLRS